LPKLIFIYLFSVRKFVPDPTGLNIAFTYTDSAAAITPSYGCGSRYVADLSAHAGQSAARTPLSGASLHDPSIHRIILNRPNWSLTKHLWHNSWICRENE